MPKLTKRLVESASPQNKDILLWDSELKGFLCKITPTGKRNYFLYYRTKDGRQRKPKIGDHGAITCEQARVIAQQWLADTTHGKDPSAERQTLRANPTLTEFAERYMTDYAPRKKIGSRKEDQRLWEQHILPTLGAFKVSSLTRDDILKLQHSLQHLSTTANRVLSLLSKAFNLAELWGYRPDHSNPCRHVKKYAEQKRERFLSQQEISCLMDVLEKEETQGIELPCVIYAIRLLLLTGCRLSEILTLRWQEVDFEKKCLNLSDSKTGKKVVYLSPVSLEVLQAVPRTEGNEYVIWGKKKESHLINLQKPWVRIRKKAGLENVRLHDLRHTFASVAAANGLSLPVIGALLGHKQTQTTARYAHLIGQTLLDATEKISNKMVNNVIK
jgi:integrase